MLYLIPELALKLVMANVLKLLIIFAFLWGIVVCPFTRRPERVRTNNVDNFLGEYSGLLRIIQRLIQEDGSLDQIENALNRLQVGSAYFQIQPWADLLNTHLLSIMPANILSI